MKEQIIPYVMVMHLFRVDKPSQKVSQTNIITHENRRNLLRCMYC